MRCLDLNIRKRRLSIVSVVFLMSVVNMLYMHYQIMNTVGLEFYFAKTSRLDNFLGVLLDVTAIFSILLLLTWGRIKASMLLTFFLTLFLSFTNVFYSRFFGQYLSLSAVGQTGNLNDKVVVMSMLSELRVHDLYYIVSIVVLLFVIWLYRNNKTSEGHLRFMGILWAVTIILVVLTHSVYWYKDSFGRAIQTLFPSRPFCSPYPNWTAFHKGVFRTIVVDNLFSQDRRAMLTEEQIKEITEDYRNHAYRKSTHVVDERIQNVIFIIVESYLSATSDLFVDGKEITPYLNRLKRDSTVYYNGEMQSNAKIGKSSDGQLIYMTGLLPLRSGITVSYAKEDSLVGLPQQLLDNGIVKHTQVLVPTSPSFWEQSSMNQVYGIKKMYAKYDDEANYDGEDLEDKKMFDFAKKLDSHLPPSSFSMLLTLSMHEPYDSPVEHGFSLSDESLPLRFRNYLVTCHYLDQQIGKYLDHLKADGLYDNSLIIITADHHINPIFIGMEGDEYERLPLYIINGNIDSSTAWLGVCNQLDVYTTVLDILGVDCEWRGLGHTLLTQDYVNSVTEKTWELSEWIILGDYFRNQ